MKHTLTDKIFLFISDCIDFNGYYYSINKAMSAQMGNPMFHKNRQWMEKYISDRKKRSKFNNVFFYLKKNGFLKTRQINNKTCYFLTPKGDIRSFRVKASLIKKKKLPQRQSVLVFFDIPEKLRSTRGIFRILLKDLGFEMLQKSIWISSYDVIDDVKIIIKKIKIDAFTHILIVKHFDE
ncbi:MAG: hypothetical protein US74_C0042G0006 [Parcubacteria group bacterium GW2011_GWA2_38_13]|nr:MAG: hypothetical protein US74_C0042G0006 [Parcubacteria group bacterium GW2011_GWA2_38_13]